MSATLAIILLQTTFLVYSLANTLIRNACHSLRYWFRPRFYAQRNNGWQDVNSDAFDWPLATTVRDDIMDWQPTLDIAANIEVTVEVDYHDMHNDQWWNNLQQAGWGPDQDNDWTGIQTHLRREEQLEHLRRDFAWWWADHEKEILSEPYRN